MTVLSHILWPHYSLTVYAVQQFLVWNAKLGQGGRFATFHRVKVEFQEKAHI